MCVFVKGTGRTLSCVILTRGPMLFDSGPEKKCYFERNRTGHDSTGKAWDSAEVPPSPVRPQGGVTGRKRTPLQTWQEAPMTSLQCIAFHHDLGFQPQSKLL